MRADADVQPIEGRGYVFEIKTSALYDQDGKSRMYKLKCDSSAEFERWLSTLREVVEGPP